MTFGGFFPFDTIPPDLNNSFRAYLHQERIHLVLLLFFFIFLRLKAFLLKLGAKCVFCYLRFFFFHFYDTFSCHIM